ncbi:DUF11 domain-containing protein [Thalassolituus oleivorans]|uniref:DUF11 domain-containing protein n=1 Tax=Thalassolituus oleivorans TaxID=187493 RepID=UPI00042DBF9E|nr:DUF11 domain-containing protein [Thalassolituus oleivorans]AHK17702.1 hypothetical protein R615_12015 [Thalassolituus oleivorans R6-15]
MNKYSKLIAPVLLGTLSGLAVNVHAAGTAAGTEVTNTATLNYQINGIDQTAVTAEDKFNVDIKVDFDLARLNTDANQTSLETDNVIVAAFVVNNTGNAPTSFAVAAANATGTTVNANGADYIDTIDLTGTYTYYVDVNGDGQLDAGDTAITVTDEIPADDSVTIFVVLPKENITGVDGDVAITDLTVNGVASTINGTTYNLDTDDNDPSNGSTDDAAIANGATTIEVVYANGATPADADNSEVLSDVLKLAFPNLNGDGITDNLTKTSVVISDPINGTTNPKAIPGAVVEYTIRIVNTGNASATNVIVTDTLPTDTTYVADSLLVSYDDLATPAAADAANVTESSGVITANLNEVAAGEANVIIVRVTIN